MPGDFRGGLDGPRPAGRVAGTCDAGVGRRRCHVWRRQVARLPQDRRQRLGVAAPPPGLRLPPEILAATAPEAHTPPDGPFGPRQVPVGSFISSLLCSSSLASLSNKLERFLPVKEPEMIKEL